ncbi:unnamed protein product [Withania somnifera]
MVDWSELQHDLLVLIVKHINLIENYLNFGTVCKSWHSVITKDNFNTEEEINNTYRKFYSLYNGIILKKWISRASGKRCTESMGWLITVEKDEGEISLLYPFSGVEKTKVKFNQTPVPWTFVQKAVLSANPDHTSDYIVTVSYDGCVQVCDVVGFEPRKSLVVAQLAPWIDGKYCILGSLSVVSQCGDDLSYVKNDRDEDEEEKEECLQNYANQGFRDRAFFLGANASISVQASQFTGVKPNHIYFTDNCLGAYLHFKEGGGLDMGVFNLADGSIRPHYEGISLSRVCPPIWVTPNPC